jgi:HK97 family phage portal protein
MWTWLRRRLRQSESWSPEVIRVLMGGAGTASGVTVTPATAVQVSAVLACVNVIAEGIGQLPMKLIRPGPGGRGSEPAEDHPLYRVLHQAPNDWQTPMEWRALMLVHALLCGSAFSIVNRAGGAVRELLPVLPQWVRVEQRQDWSLRWTVQWPKGGRDEFGPGEMWMLRGPGFDGVLGWQSVSLLREAIGLAMVAESTGARAFGNGGMPGGILEMPGTVTVERAEEIAKAWRKNYGGDNAGKIAVLMGGTKFQPVEMKPAEMQSIETRRYQIEEIARGFRVFPHMIGAGEQNTTYASAEAFFSAHVAYTLMPWITRIEQTTERDCFTAADRAAGLQAKIAVQALLRGNARDRALFYGSGIKDGWMTRNEARALEDFNPLEGLDVPLMPLHMADGSEPPAASDAENDAARSAEAATQPAPDGASQAGGAGARQLRAEKFHA